jgi:putative FmdB family regulatory protein
LALEVCECQEETVPTYQYACTACGHQLEAVQSFADEPLTECPACEGRLRKLFSSVGVVFKGSGFYRNDSRTGSASSSGRDSDSAKESSAGKETKDTTASSPKTESSTSSTSSTAPKKDAVPAATKS